MSKQNNSVSINLTGPFFSALTLLFVAFKLLGKFDHSWWVVFAPLWVPIVAVFGGIFVVLIVLSLVYFILWSINWIVEHFRFKRYQKQASERLRQVVGQKS